jgi:hypothetical protein
MTRRWKGHKSRAGGASIFLCIILSLILLTESILFAAALERQTEADILRCMRLQAEAALCRYNEPLLRNYGLYGLGSSPGDIEVFTECFKGSDAAIAVTGFSEMSSAELKKAISDYMKVRIPSIVSSDLLSRLRGVLGEIYNSDFLKTIEEARGSGWISYLNDILKNSDKWGSVITQAVTTAKMADFTGTLNRFDAFCQTYMDTAKRKATLFAQGDANPALLLDTGRVSDIMGTLDSLLDTDLPDFADNLLVNEYAVSFMDSCVKETVDGDRSEPESNILGIPYNSIHESGNTDLEYVLTGIDNGIASGLIAKTLILDTRTVVNLAAFIIDSEKMNQAKEIGTVLSLVIIAASLGTVEISPEIFQYVVLLIWAEGQALVDVMDLIAGKGVPLLNHSAIDDEEMVKDLLMTEYRVYIRMNLMIVPSEWKLSRILSILKRDSGGYIYTGVRVQVEYRNRSYQMEDSYDAYVMEKAV